MCDVKNCREVSPSGFRMLSSGLSFCERHHEERRDLFNEFRHALIEFERKWVDAILLNEGPPGGE